MRCVSRSRYTYKYQYAWCWCNVYLTCRQTGQINICQQKSKVLNCTRSKVTSIIITTMNPPRKMKACSFAEEWDMNIYLHTINICPHQWHHHHEDIFDIYFPNEHWECQSGKIELVIKTQAPECHSSKRGERGNSLRTKGWYWFRLWHCGNLGHGQFFSLFFHFHERCLVTRLTHLCPSS